MSPRRISPVDRSVQQAGSPLPGGPAFVVTGRLRRPHGINGEILMEVGTHFPQRLHRGKEVFVGEEHRSLRIRTVRSMDRNLLLSFDGFDSVEQVATLVNLQVFARVDQLPALPAGEYYHHELLGMAVFDERDTPLGTLVEILETGANDVYVVETNSGEILLPAIEDVILDVNPGERRMRVKPPEYS